MRLQTVKGTAITVAPEILASEHFTAKPVTIDADFVRADADGNKIAKNCVLGKITASGLYAPVKRTTVASGGGAGVTTCVLTDAQFFQAGDALSIGGDSKTIATIDYDTKAITWAGAIDVADGDDVKATNGLGTAAGILQGLADLTNGDGAFSMLTHATVYEARVAGLNALTKADMNLIQYR